MKTSHEHPQFDFDAAIDATQPLVDFEYTETDPKVPDTHGLDELIGSTALAKVNFDLIA